MQKIFTRMGDGWQIELSEAEIRSNLAENLGIERITPWEKIRESEPR